MIALTPYSRSIIANLQTEHRQAASQWLELGIRSENLIDELHSQIHPTSKTRYRFTQNSREATTKAIFETAFKKAPDRVIETAETATGTSFYPLWKRIIRIDLPRMVGDAIGNRIIRIALCIAAALFAAMTGYHVYGIIQHFIGARAIPYIINNTPVKVIHVFNTAIKYLSLAYKHWYITLFSAWVLKNVILHVPEIPYVTAAVRSIDLIAFSLILMRSPQTVGSFLFSASIDMLMSINNGCQDVSQFCLHAAEKAESERLAFSKQRAYALWTQATTAPA